MSHSNERTSEHGSEEKKTTADELEYAKFLPSGKRDDKHGDVYRDKRGKIAQENEHATLHEAASCDDVTAGQPQSDAEARSRSNDCEAQDQNFQYGAEIHSGVPVLTQ
jgi:hypothetical protein